MSATRIAVIGANGQVGFEICLLLRLIPDIEVVPISRSVHGTSLLRRCGFECRHGTIDSPEAARALLGDCEVVLDFALPSGTISQMQATIDRMIDSAMRGGDKLQRYVYMSTKAVCRLLPDQPFYRRYGTIKHYGEKAAFRFGRQHGKEVYALRLGEVYGELQAVSRKVRREMRPGEVSVPEGPSNSVFVFSIAEAVDHIRRGKVEPSTYSLVSNPAWTWTDIHEYYAKELGMETVVRTHSAPRRAVEFRSVKNVVAVVKKEITAQIFGYRDLIDDVLVRISPDQSAKLRAFNAKTRTLRDVANDPARQAWKPYPEEFVMPGRRLDCLSDSRVSMHEAAEAVKKELASAAPELISTAGLFRS